MVLLPLDDEVMFTLRAVWVWAFVYVNRGYDIGSKQETLTCEWMITCLSFKLEFEVAAVMLYALHDS